MKLGVISDIHLDVNEQYPVVELLAKEAERRKLEGLLLAGDISNGPKSTLRHLEQMKKRLPVPFVSTLHSTVRWKYLPSSPRILMIRQKSSFSMEKV